MGEILKTGKEESQESIIDEIVNTITAYLHPKRIYLFGSRAMGRSRRYSDFDIAVEGVKMTHRSERELKEALDARLGIFTVDLVNLDNVEPEFKMLILKTGRVVYEQR